MIYFIVFSLSILLLVASDKMNSKKISSICVILAIFLPSALAGLRENGVGIDTTVYGYPAFVWAQQYDFLEYLKKLGDSPLFYTMWYLSSRIFKITFAPYFILECCIEMLIYLTLKHVKKKVDIKIWLGMLVYYCLFWGFALSQMRQFLALSIILFAYEMYLEENEYKKYFFWIILAILTHTSAVVGIGIGILYSLFHSEFMNKSYVRVLFYVLSLSMIGVLFIFYNKILSWIIGFYDHYTYYTSNKSDFMSTWNVWMYFLGEVVYLLIVAVVAKTRDIMNSFEFYLIANGLILFWINLFSNNAYRLSFYLLSFLIILGPKCFTGINQDKFIVGNLQIFQSIYIFLLVESWFVLFYLWRTNDIIPYISILKV